MNLEDIFSILTHFGVNHFFFKINVIVNILDEIALKTGWLRRTYLHTIIC